MTKTTSQSVIELPIKGFAPVIQYKQQPVFFFRYEPTETGNDTYLCRESTVTIPNATYENMTSHLIAVKYDIDAQLALLYNYQTDPEKYAGDMAKYQAWRVYCKSSARQFFGIKE